MVGRPRANELDQGVRAAGAPVVLAGWSLFAIYVIWGTSFLGLRVGVQYLPPMLLAGLRYGLAGGLIGVLAIARERPGGIAATDLRRYVVTGIAMFVGSGFLLPYGVQQVPSGMAAILTATIPLWMVAFEMLRGHIGMSARIAVGLALGILGVLVISRPEGTGSGDIVPMLAILAAAALWSIGSLSARHRTSSQGPLTVTSVQMLVGSLVLLVAATVTGDVRSTHLDDVPLEGWLALGWLVVPVGVVTFASFNYALRVFPSPIVAAYPFFNTLVAVALGWAILAESVRPSTLAGCALVLVGAGMIMSRSGARARLPPAT